MDTKNKFPLYYITWNTTCLCNLKCKHCYNEKFTQKNLAEELSEEKIKNIINDAIDLGLRAILFTGGEPLMRKDLLEIMKYAKNRKLLVFLATNGTLIDKNFIKEFGGIVDKINISIDAASPKEHDEIRGVEGSFKKSMDAVKRLKDQFNVSLAFTVHSGNLKELEKVAKIAKDNNIGLTVKRYIPVGKSIKNNICLSDCDYKEIITIIDKLKKGQKISFKDPFPDSSGKDLNKFGGCLGGIYSLSVDFNGNIYICTKLKLLIGNVNNKTLEDIWNNSEILKKLRNRELKGKCAYCDKIFSCGGCRAAAYAKTGDFLAEDPLCYYNAKVKNNVKQK